MSPQHLSIENTNTNRYKKLCVFCNSQNIVKLGYSYSKARGKTQRFKCKNCGKTFCVNQGFLKMKNKPEIITFVLDLFYSNLSTRTISRRLKTYFNVQANHITIWRWIIKYSKQVSDFVKKLPHEKLSGKFYVDETLIKRKGNLDRFWACVDGDTRYLVATHYSKRKNWREAQELMFNLKRVYNPEQMIKIQSDSMASYKKGVKRGLRLSNKDYRNKHIKVNTYKTGKFNVPIERFFRNLKMKFKTIYQFQTEETAKIILDGFCVWYNFCRYHLTLKSSPAEKVFNLNLGENKWLGLIYLASS